MSEMALVLLFVRLMRPKCRSCNHSRTQRSGHYVRKSDRVRVNRWKCASCKRYTSSASRSPCYRQNKRHLNHVILKLLCSSVSQRRIAFLLGISRLTVARKFIFLGTIAAQKNERQRQEWSKRPFHRVYDAPFTQ